jgi:hypothetical protein
VAATYHVSVSRRIDLEEDALVIRYAGASRALILTGEVRVPYSAIASVSIGLSDPPGWLHFRIGYSTPPFGTTQRGRFREHGTWSFFDVDDRERAVVLDLTGHGYRRVVLTVDDPEAFAASLRERRPDRG